MEAPSIPRYHATVPPQDDPGTKQMTLRLERDLADRLEAVSEVEGRSMAAVVRDAIADHVERRRRDPDFRRRLDETLRRQRRLLELLADDEA